MIKRVFIKKILVNYVFPLFSLINNFIPKDENIILIYCANDELNDNSEAIFNYLLSHNYNTKYKVICAVGSTSKYRNRVESNVFFISKLRCIFTYMRSGHVFYCMGKMPIKPTKKQIVINMWHGIPIKKIGLLSNVSNGKEFFFTYVCAPSETWRPIMAKAFGCPETNVCICGEPKADILFKKKKNRKEKLIVWTPTFRKSQYLGYEDSAQSSLLPLFPQSDWENLNHFLKERNIRIIVKLHPMQDLHGFNSLKLSNFEVYSSNVFENEIGNIFELLSQSDALISDYSGIYFDYMVLDRPICFILDDFDSYSNTRGFVFDSPLDFMPGYKVYNQNDFYRFIDDFFYGIDLFEYERKEVNKLVNLYSDGKNCERVLKYANIHK